LATVVAALGSGLNHSFKINLIYHDDFSAKAAVIIKILKGKGKLIMAVPDKVEAVKKVTETLSKQSHGAEEMERMSPNKEHFDTLMNSSQVKPTSFERIDTKVFGAEEVQSVEQKPVFAEENVSTQKKRNSDRPRPKTPPTATDRRS